MIAFLFAMPLVLMFFAMLAGCCCMPLLMLRFCCFSLYTFAFRAMLPLRAFATAATPLRSRYAADMPRYASAAARRHAELRCYALDIQHIVVITSVIISPVHVCRRCLAPVAGMFQRVIQRHACRHLLA